MPLKHFQSISYSGGQRRPPSLPPRRRRSGGRWAWFKDRLSWAWLPKIFILGLLGAGAGALILVILFVWYSQNLPDPSNLSRRATAGSTKIYDRTGETVLYDIHGDEKRTPIKLSEIPDHLKNATLVAEDRDFYQHRGFDLTGIARAVVVDIIRRDSSQGGSTITQQLVKNTIVGKEKTLGRKIKELILAYRIEQQFSKDEIIELYLNAIPYGGTAYGIESAAQNYFRKAAKDLTLAEAATLAALPQGPTRLSPYGNNKDRLIARQQYILNEMARLKYITDDQAKAALAEPLNFTPIKNSILAPHFVFYIREYLTEKYGEATINSGGYKIITTLDLYKQKIAEEEVLAGALKNESKYGGENAALVALDPKTGQILAMVGSRDYFDTDIDGQVNVALRLRQPGSSIKPIIYTTAFSKGFTPEAILYDVVTTFKTETADYIPHDYDGGERGPVSLRQALAGSLNIPAVKLLYLTGLDDVLAMAQSLGYSTFGDRSRFGLSLVLGGAEVKLLEHAAAFQALAREGTYHSPTGILRIEDSGGKVLESFKDSPQNVIDGNAARMTASVMSDNGARAFVFGANSPLQLGDRPVAAKTGTTNDWRDGWTIGFTPSLVAGVWVGNNDGSTMNRGADGSLVAAPIWNGFMKRVLGGTPIENFRAPDPTPLTNPALQGQIPAETTVVIDKISGKRATEFTPPELREEKTYPAQHTILYYLDRNNLTGPPPERPEADPNYKTWEEAVQRWLSKQSGASSILPPNDFDDVHTAANQPSLTIASPLSNETVRGQSLSITAVASAPRGLVAIRFSLDGVSLGQATESGTYQYAVPAGTAAGFHIIRVEAVDDVGNKKINEVTINYIP